MSRIAEVLAALRKEREGLLAEVSRIDQAIAALEDVADRVVEGAAVREYPEDAKGRTPGPYSLFGICEAAAAYLATVEEPQTTREIAEALQAGGIRTTSVNFADTVGTLLRSSAARFGISHTGTATRRRWFLRR
jgi:hypothetical protein